MFIHNNIYSLYLIFVYFSKIKCYNDLLFLIQQKYKNIENIYI